MHHEMKAEYLMLLANIRCPQVCHCYLFNFGECYIFLLSHFLTRFFFFFSIPLLQAATSIGNSGSNLANSRQSAQPAYPSSAASPLSSHSPSVVSPPAPTPQIPSLSLLSSSNPTPLQDTLDPISNSNRGTNLLKPSSFFAPPSSSSALIMPPISSSVPTAPSLHPPLNLQRPYGTPMLQPFPPPTPPSSLTPSSASPIDGLLISRDRVRDALLVLVQVLSSILFFLFPDYLVCSFNYRKILLICLVWKTTLKGIVVNHGIYDCAKA